jgi:uncharacterized protein
MIFETIIITVDVNKKPHVTPFGVRFEGENVVIAPYKPSTTLNNILATQFAVMNMTDDVRVFAGALTGSAEWSLLPTNNHAGYRLADCLAHTVLQLIEVHDNETRPQLVMQAVSSENYQSFQGFNRAQAAVVELSILVSRLQMLPKEKVLAERAYLQIAIDKTAGEREIEAWRWLVEKIDNFYAEQLDRNQP